MRYSYARGSRTAPSHTTERLAVMYLRVSTREQEEEGFSIPAQRRLLDEYAARHGVQVVEVFQDIETAKRSGRKDFQRMMRFLAATPSITIVLAEKTDRLYRNFEDQVALKAFGLEIHLVKEGETVSSESKSHQKLTHNLKTMLATFYSDNLSEEVTKGMLEKARGGDAPGKAPIGYLNDRNSKRIIIDPDRAPLVRRAFELYATGDYSLFDIRKALIEMGFALRNGGRPPRTSIELMLKNPFYYGEFRWRGQLFKGNHEPLISRSLFDRVQTKLADKGPGVFQEREFAFGQFMTCGHCGCAITAEIKKEKYIYYRCTNGKGKCPQKYVREEALVGQFAEVVRAVRLDPRLASWIEEAVLEANEDEHRLHEAEVARLNAEIARLTQRLERIYIDKLDGHVSDELWAKMSGEMKAAKRDAEARLGALGRADQNFKALVQSTLELAQTAHSLFLGEPPHQQRELLYHVLSNCKMKDGVVVPEYRKPFALLAHAAKQWDQEKAASGSSDPKAAIRWA